MAAIAQSLNVAAVIAVGEPTWPSGMTRAERLQRALRLFAAAEAAHNGYFAATPLERPEYDIALNIAQAGLGPASAEAARAEGLAASLADAIDIATRGGLRRPNRRTTAC